MVVARFFAHRPRTKPPADSSDENFRLADNTRIALSEALSGDPIGDGRSSPDRLFFCYPLDDYRIRLAEGWRFAVLVMLFAL